MGKSVSVEIRILVFFAVILIAGYLLIPGIIKDATDLTGPQLESKIGSTVIVFSLVVFSTYTLSWIIRLFKAAKKT